MGTGVPEWRWKPSKCHLWTAQAALVYWQEPCPKGRYWLLFLGDSTQRQFEATLRWLIGAHSCLRTKYIKSHLLEDSIRALRSEVPKILATKGVYDTVFIIINNGLHDICNDSLTHYARLIHELFSEIRKLERVKVIWRSTSSFHFHPWGMLHQQMSLIPLCPYFTPQRLQSANDVAYREADVAGIPVWDTFAINKQVGFLDGRDGTHVCFFSKSDAERAIQAPSLRQCVAFIETLLSLITNQSTGQRKIESKQINNG
eukprot:CAMPEP_0172583680 /NCGR_PEP_ID=MMETSP1068-20121228/3262_1 /TAXON_ID=35684 /ORGANISM="Pseudopedinella elastica, Strain CCMP716" /LENGTH=257 /DNA_ID=CAMNT_0013377557 /DNA_START=846 /DNA_END=1619 /DNA_ORIENTATION=+